MSDPTITQPPFEFDRAVTRADHVFQALGAASVCWDNLSGAGVFDSTRAKAIGDALLVYLAEHDAQPRTTNQLIHELDERIDALGSPRMLDLLAFLADTLL